MARVLAACSRMNRAISVGLTLAVALQSDPSQADDGAGSNAKRHDAAIIRRIIFAPKVLSTRSTPEARLQVGAIEEFLCHSALFCRNARSHVAVVLMRGPRYARRRATSVGFNHMERVRLIVVVVGSLISNIVGGITSPGLGCGRHCRCRSTRESSTL